MISVIFCSADQKQDWIEIVRGEIEFYAHVFLKIGIRLGYWQKVGNTQEVGKTDVCFRNTDDYGDPEIAVSEKWHIWKLNEPFSKVGRLEGRNRGTEIGIVIPPDSIVHRMKVGEYDFVYPGY